MIWVLPLASGIGAVAVLAPVLPVTALPLVVLALVALGVSLTGRLPWTGSAFAGCLIALAVIATPAAGALAPAGLLFGAYLVLLDARESLPELSALPRWTGGQALVVPAVVLGVATPLAAALLPLPSSTATTAVLVLIAGAAAAGLYWWVAPGDR